MTSFKSSNLLIICTFFGIVSSLAFHKEISSSKLVMIETSFYFSSCRTLMVLFCFSTIMHAFIHLVCKSMKVSTNSSSLISSSIESDSYFIVKAITLFVVSPSLSSSNSDQVMVNPFFYFC